LTVAGKAVMEPLTLSRVWIPPLMKVGSLDLPEEMMSVWILPLTVANKVAVELLDLPEEMMSV
jgi:hypothetical protein